MPKPKPPAELSRRQRRDVRYEVASAYESRLGRCDLEALEEHCRNAGEKPVGQDFKADAYLYSDELVNYWFDREIDEPPAVAVTGEPRAGVEW